MPSRTKYLDRRLTEADVTVSYSGGVTTWTLPYSVAVDGSEGAVVVANQATDTIFGTTRPAPNQVAKTGDYSGNAVYIGVAYLSMVEPGPLNIRDGQRTPQLNGRVTFTHMDVLVADTHAIEGYIRPSYRAPRAGGFIWSSTPITGAMRWALHLRNTDFVFDLYTETAAGFRIMGLFFEGKRSGRTRRSY